jgi:mono/diheme cytochrome c family protein
VNLRASIVGLGVLPLALLAAGCRQDMQDQAKLEPLEASALFGNGAASRTPVEGTVARGQLREDDRFYLGVEPDGSPLSALPLPLTSELVARGRRNFDAFCSPCHDRLGEGRGMIVRRGFKQPNSFHEQRLREAPPGYFFSVMTNGFGQMSSYADKLTAEDRWAVIAYVRALQMSQAAPRELLGAEDLAALERAAQPAASEAEAPHGGEEGHE